WSESLLAGLAAWLAFDLVGCAALTLVGLRRAWRSEAGTRADAGGCRRRVPWPALILRATVVAIPLQLLRLVNAVSYVASASRTLPALLRGSRHLYAPVHRSQAGNEVAAVRRPSITWER